MDTVLPNYPPYIIKFGKKITINVGQPINISDLVNSLKMKNTPEPIARKIITDRLQDEMNVSFFWLAIDSIYFIAQITEWINNKNFIPFVFRLDS